MKSKLLILCLFFSFFSCQKKATINESNFRAWLNPDEKLERVLTLKVNLRVSNDDQFKIYYAEDNSENFNEEKIVKTKVKGANSEQTITFKFPKDANPTNIRLDFGLNKKQVDFKINKFEFSYKNSYFGLTSEILFDYFKVFDNRLIFNQTSRLLKVNKDTKGKQYHPTIVSKEILTKELKDLLETERNNDRTVKFSLEQLTDLTSAEEIKSSIENFKYNNNHLNLKGWAILENVNSKNTKTTVLFINNTNGYLVEATRKTREDVTKFFKLNYNADFSGFETEGYLNYIPTGKYKLALWLKNQKENKEGLLITDKEILIQ